MIEGTYNFRDTGGLPLAGGGTTRHGVLYRSDALSALTPRGLEALAATSVGVVVDFRTPMERAIAPDVLPDSRAYRVVELSILEGTLAGLAQDLLRAGGGDADLHARVLEHLPTLPELYIGMLQHAAASFAEAARLVAVSTDDKPTSVLMHCTAGKDRTGVATALLLDAVGVERTAVVADYAASEANLAGPWADAMLAMVEQIGAPLTPGVRELIVETPPAALEHAFGWVDAEYGGSAEYLRAGGLSDAELAALRGRLAG